LIRNLLLAPSLIKQQLVMVHVGFICPPYLWFGFGEIANRDREHSSGLRRQSSEYTPSLTIHSIENRKGENDES
jgi:hypothetical protein